MLVRTIKFVVAVLPLGICFAIALIGAVATEVGLAILEWAER